MLTKNEALVLDFLKSCDTPVLRESLVAVTLLSDRQVRHIIQKLRHKDNWIISTPKIPGYRITESQSEWNLWVAHWNRSHQFTMLKKSNRNANQITLEAEVDGECLYLKGIISQSTNIG